jgi:hypothetical protein
MEQKPRIFSNGPWPAGQRPDIVGGDPYDQEHGGMTWEITLSPDAPGPLHPAVVRCLEEGPMPPDEGFLERLVIMGYEMGLAMLEQARFGTNQEERTHWAQEHLIPLLRIAHAEGQLDAYQHVQVHLDGRDDCMEPDETDA